MPRGKEMDRGFEKLYQPIAVGNLVLKHRMIMAPMMKIFGAENGELTQSVIDYYRARAKGGAALITTGLLEVLGRNIERYPRIDDDKYVPGLRRLAETIHSEGVPIVVQLHHGGSSAGDPVSPSGVPCLTAGQEILQSRAMSLEEIEEIKELFVQAALRVKLAGCDGVAPHGAATYLLQQFFSPRMNLRTDLYGGSLENRMRLPLEIVRGIRKRCGPEFVIGYAMVVDELSPGGIVLEDSLRFAIALEKEGVDYIDVRAGTHESFAVMESGRGHSNHQPRTGIWEYSEPVKKVLKIPVFCSTSGCYDPALWEEALEKGKADVISLAKPVICDPDMPKKVLEGRLEDIRQCILCIECLGYGARGCSLNAEVGREGEYSIERANNPKKVLVAGGGPGGLEAARVAALRGHNVTVMDKEAEAGGNLRIIGLCKGNDLLLNFRDWLIRQCIKAGVRVELGKEVTPQVVRQANPDVVIAATGAPVPVIPPIPGIQKSHVVTAVDVITGKVPVGKNVVVIGGGRVGVDTAYTIAAKGLAGHVTIVEPFPVSALAYDMSILCRTYMLFVLLPKYGVQGLTGMRIEEITDREVMVVDREGKRQKIKGDSVVIALGYRPNMNLYESLRGENIELYAVGDCEKARSIADAVDEGARVARQI
jgi:2,4-dienoyl-CoA reductase-like NADH-dependent reductase (Old Yellow Enzyme family)/thioredoxin reductase